MKTAHLFPDNSTFAKSFLFVLDKFNGGRSNTYFLYFKEIPKTLKQYTTDYNVRAITSVKLLESELLDFDQIVFHSLYPHYLSLIPKLKNKRIGWVFWGYEYYNYFETSNYEPLTKSKVPARNIQKKLAAVYRKHQLKMAFKRIDDFYFWDETFYNHLKSSFGMKAKFHEFLYSRSILEPTSPVPLESKEKLTVLVGNSAYLSGNQPDAFAKIKEFNEVEKVFVMLSYGFESHKNVITRQGKKHLGNRFIALTEFLPYEEYLSMIKSVDVIVCNHNRMQALGLIFNAILMQRPLIINPKSLFYHKLNDLGIRLYSFESLGSTTIASQETLIQNREILLKKITPDLIRNQYQAFLS